MMMSTPLYIDTTKNTVSSSSSMNMTSPAFESTLISYASRMLKIKSPQTAVIDDSVAPYVTSILRSAFSNLSPTDLARVRTTTDTDEKDGSSSPLEIQEVVDEYDALMELLMEQCEMEQDKSRETLASIARAIQTGDCEVSLSDHHSHGHGGNGLLFGNSHSGMVGSRKLSFNGALVGNGTLMMGGYGGLGDRYRSKSMGAEHDSYAEEDAIRLLGDMLNERNNGNSMVHRKKSIGSSSLSTLPPWSVANRNDDDSPGRGAAGGVIEEEPSIFFDEEESESHGNNNSYAIASSETHEENKNQGYNVLSLPVELQTPLKQDATNFLSPGFSPFMTEEEKKVAESLKNLPAPTFSFTPLKQDQLIPLDLLGAIDDPSSPMGILGMVKPEEASTQNPSELVQMTATTSPLKQSPQSMNMEEEGASGGSTLGNSDKPDAVSRNGSEPFASPLPVATNNGSPTSESAATPAPQGKPVIGKGKKKGKKNNDLAAALFTRPRSRSMQNYDEKSPKLKPMAPPPASQIGMAGLKNCSADALMKNSIPALFQKQLDSAVEILLAMNYDICREAAHEAALVSNADVNIAQHVIDGALAAPPVCRHLLNDGCYRSDCHFSHDVDGHTCLFWLRGRCGKGADSCRFMHGFSEKLLDGVDVEQVSCFVLPPAQAAQKPSVVKTGNLVQHNMMASFSSASRGVFSSNNKVSDVPRNRAVSDAGTFYSSIDLSADPPLSKTPPPVQVSSNPILGTTSRETGSQSGSPPTFSFASIASKGYSKGSSFNKDKPVAIVSSGKAPINDNKKTVRIPQNLWTASYQRSAGAFRITDPIARYKEVANSVQRNDVIDLHFQSLKTFPTVLSTILPEKLKDHREVWIVTGSGHHVSKNSHQKQGGILESAVVGWLVSNDYNFAKGKDKNGHSGALMVYSR